MFFTNKHIDNADIEVKINGNVIKCCNSLTFLGVQIYSKFSWHIHIEFICNKISKIWGIFNKLNHFPCNDLVMNYNALFLPDLNYCNIAWAKANDYCMTRLYKL